MRALRLSLLTLALLLVTHQASAQKRTTIGFDTDCAGSGTPGIFVGGYKQVSGSLYAACGVASISSGGLTGQQQLAQSGGLPLIGNINGVTGSVALAGAFTFTSFGTLTIVFATAVNEISFDALELDNKSGLSIELSGTNGTTVGAIDHPTADGNKIVHYSRTSVTPILRLTISYDPAPALLILGDGWFIDQLSFNAWQCGDGELEGGAGEVCDDANTVQCDGCNNSCQTSITGCVSGSTCVANGMTSGCAVCDLSAPAGPTGVPTTLRAPGSACDDGLFCTLPGSCDSGGVCQSAANTCDDNIACTNDRCDEGTDQCLHPIADKWCLINGACVTNGSPNTANPCQVCTAATLPTGWDAQPVGKLCGDPSCMGGTAMSAPTCAAGGVCTAAAAQACQFAMCANTISCDGHCGGDQQCPQQAYCDIILTGCVSDLPAASACTRDAQCASNLCADGVCCDKACNGACEACNLAGKVGLCTPLAAMAIDPEGRCGAGQYCSAGGLCTTPPPVTPPPVNPPPTSVPVDIRPMGTGCDRNEVCGSGVCKDGVCCDRACEGLCESCAVAGQPAGQCLPFALGEDPDSECGGAGSVCNGDNTCTSYETRGNGLCAAAPSARSDGSRMPLSGLIALLTLGLALVWRRRRATQAPRKRT